LAASPKALRAGIPQLIRPTSHDQFDNAYRASQLGVARSLRIKRFTVNNVVAALQELLESPVVAQRCSHYAAQCQRSQPTNLTCGLIEALVGQDCRITIPN
jgi:UDP:flavonoid glycosyltransferase YjiC (YdhE family)